MTSQLLNERYQIIRSLGSGGFGETFLAEDTHMPSRRRCVVKRLRPIQENSQINQLVQERFQREAAILEELGNGHRQIPTLYAYFYGQVDRQFYLVQEWIDGDTLGAVISQQKRVPEVEVRRILVTILPVFDYIHRKGIVHRDVKPENIILRRQDRQPVLIDFGAVRETMGTEINAQGRPTQSIVIGTPGYMASEQSIGRPVFNSDLYSLGLTAIYLLTGKNPQEFVNNPATGEIMWRGDVPQISEDLANILEKAIASHPRDRHQTAAEFLAALQPASVTVVPERLGVPATAATLVVAPAVTEVAQPLVKPQRRNRFLVILFALVLGSGVLAALLLRFPERAVVTVSRSSSVSPTPSALAPSVSLVPTPATTLASRPSVVVALSPAVPTVPVANPTPSPAVATPSVVMNNDYSTPATIVNSYYQDINSRSYQSAWNKLPIELRANTKVHPQGYDSFVQWWNSVEAVEMVRVQPLRQNDQRALVNVKAIYRMRNGQSQPFILKYILVKNMGDGSWSIERIRR